MAESAYACARLLLSRCETRGFSKGEYTNDTRMLTIMPIDIVKMGAHPKPASAIHGKCHFPPAMRERASSCFKSAHSITYGYDLHSISDYRGKSKGNQRDVVWELAFKTFVSGHSEHQISALPRKITYKNFKDLVLKWYDAWDRGLDCVRASLRGAHVTYDQLLHLATLVAGGREGEDGSWSHYQSLREAKDECEELNSYMDDYKLSESTLHNLLVQKFKLLKYTKADERAKHAKSTLLKRQRCSAIWRGEEPWLRSELHTRAGESVPINFEWDWYSNFTFMIDAVSFEDGGSSSSKTRRVYSPSKQTFPPALYEQVKRIDSTSRAMYYVVLHAHEGVVCGPDLVFTGSKVPESQKGNKAGILQNWCEFKKIGSCLHASLNMLLPKTHV